jgi:plastocyanin
MMEERRLMFRKLLALLSLAMVAMLLLAACGDGDDNGDATTPGAAGDTSTPAASPAGEAIHVQMLDTMRFEPDTITVSAGEEVTIELENAGAIMHNFSITEANVDQDLDGRQSETFTFTAPSEPGEYKIFCDVPGHEQAGMVATLVVE